LNDISFGRVLKYASCGGERKKDACEGIEKNAKNMKK